MSQDAEVVYRSYDDLYDQLHRRMAADGYKLVRERSHRDKTKGAVAVPPEPIRVDLVCDRGGRPHQSMATRRRSSTKKTGCPWKAKAVRRKAWGGWILTILCGDHNHEPRSPDFSFTVNGDLDAVPDAADLDDADANPANPDPEVLPDADAHDDDNTDPDSMFRVPINTCSENTNICSFQTRPTDSSWGLSLCR